MLLGLAGGHGGDRFSNPARNHQSEKQTGADHSASVAKRAIRQSLTARWEAFMRNAVNADRLAGISARLGDTVIDPTIWPEVLDQISVATGSVGAGLLQSDVRSTDIPRSAGADEAFTS